MIAPRGFVAEHRCRRGLSLIEVVASTLLIGILMTAALTSVGASARSSTAAVESGDATALARQLLEEISVLPYEDPNQTPVFGTEASESPGGGVRTSLDDMDDYMNLTDTPPKDRTGTAIPGFSGWTRTADVEKIAFGTFLPLSDAVPDTGERRITVTVSSPSGRTTTLQALRTRVAGSLQPQGVTQTLVTWVGLKLQSGSGSAVVSGVSLINHATDQ